MTLKNFIYVLTEYYKEHPKFFRRQCNETFRKKICKGTRMRCMRCEIDKEVYDGKRIAHDCCWIMANELLEKIIRKEKLRKLLS